MEPDTKRSSLLTGIVDHDGVFGAAIVDAAGAPTHRCRTTAPLGLAGAMTGAVQWANDHASLLSPVTGPDAGRIAIRASAGPVTLHILSGPNGTAVIATETGHAVVKSIRRMLRRLAGVTGGTKQLGAPRVTGRLVDNPHLQAPARSPMDPTPANLAREDDDDGAHRTF